MKKELTPMAKHIVDLKKIQQIIIDKNYDADLTEAVVESIGGCIENAESFLPEERRVIEAAHLSGFNNPEGSQEKAFARLMFDETYRQK